MQTTVSRKIDMQKIGNARAVLLALLLFAVVGCETADDKELKRLQLERMRLETALQSQKLVSEKARSEQEDRTRLALMKAEEERLIREREASLALQRAETERMEREKNDRVREQQAQETLARADQANSFVKSRAEIRVAKIASVLLGADPSVSVSTHDCARSGAAFTAALKVFYKGGISGDALSVTGKLVRNGDGSETFRYDPLPPEILGRLTFIGMPKDKLELFARGDAWLSFD
jgi:hypothetical protein